MVRPLLVWEDTSFRDRNICSMVYQFPQGHNWRRKVGTLTHFGLGTPYNVINNRKDKHYVHENDGTTVLDREKPYSWPGNKVNEQLGINYEKSR